MRIQGRIEVRDSHHIAGWICDQDDPLNRMELDIVYGDSAIGHCTADKFREDLASQKIGDGRCTFEFSLPPFVPKSEIHRLGVRVSGTSLFLQYAPPSTSQKAETVSRFGGLWIDRLDWIDELGLRHRSGVLSDDLCQTIFKFVRDGYVVIPKAVSHELVDELNEEIEQLWENPPADLLIETWEPDGKLKLITARKDYRYGSTKLLDVYVVSRSAREAITAPKVMEFLRAIFDDTPKAFQSLHFSKGSEQAMHKDAIYVKVDSNPMHLAATWLALEDIRPGTGELTYYVGSHRAPEFLFGGAYKWVESNPQEGDRFLENLHDEAKKFKQLKSSFLAKKGDVLVWHADLAHGGAKIEHPGSTRKSLVAHFTAAADEPYYRREHQYHQLTENGCVFVSNYAGVGNRLSRLLSTSKRNFLRRLSMRSE